MLKESLITAPVLRIADLKLPFYVYTDVSGFAISSWLSQDDGNGHRPVGYNS